MKCVKDKKDFCYCVKCSNFGKEKNKMKENISLYDKKIDDCLYYKSLEDLFHDLKEYDKKGLKIEINIKEVEEWTQ